MSPSFHSPPSAGWQSLSTLRSWSRGWNRRGSRKEKWSWTPLRSGLPGKQRHTHTHIKKGKSKTESVHLNYLINIQIEITVQCLYSVHSIRIEKQSKGKSSKNWLIYILLHYYTQSIPLFIPFKATNQGGSKKQINITDKTKNMWIVLTIKITIKPSHRGNNDFLKFFAVLLFSAFLYTFLNRQQF